METNDNKFMIAVAYVLQRLKEPSSWAGIALFIGFFGLSEDTMNRVLANGPAIVTALAALIAIIAPSAGRKAIALARDAQATAVDAQTSATAVTKAVENAGVPVPQAVQPALPDAPVGASEGLR